MPSSIPWKCSPWLIILRGPKNNPQRTQNHHRTGAISSQIWCRWSIGQTLTRCCTGSAVITHGSVSNFVSDGPKSQTSTPPRAPGLWCNEHVCVTRHWLLQLLVASLTFQSGRCHNSPKSQAERHLLCRLSGLEPQGNISTRGCLPHRIISCSCFISFLFLTFWQMFGSFSCTFVSVTSPPGVYPTLLPT